MFEVGKFLPINGIGEVLGKFLLIIYRDWRSFREVFTYLLTGLEKF